MFCSEFKGSYNPLKGFQPTWFKRSYADCVRTDDPECRFIPGHNGIAHNEGGAHASQIMFFCGHDPVCAVVNSKEALE